MSLHSASGLRIPRKARERAVAHESALARLPADYMYALAQGVKRRPLRQPLGEAAGRLRAIRTSTDTPREYTIRNRPESLPGPLGPVLFFGGPRRQTTLGHRPRGNREDRQTAPRGRARQSDPHGATKAIVDRVSVSNLAIHISLFRTKPASMDAKQVWRAALGELQVSLSPANYETWLRDTVLVDVDDTRFKIAVPNGFAKDWLETRYRSLISQTLARIVGLQRSGRVRRSAGRRDERRQRRRRPAQPRLRLRPRRSASSRREWAHPTAPPRT